MLVDDSILRECWLLPRVMRLTKTLPIIAKLNEIQMMTGCRKSMRGFLKKPHVSLMSSQTSCYWSSAPSLVDLVKSSLSSDTYWNALSYDSILSGWPSVNIIKDPKRAMIANKENSVDWLAPRFKRWAAIRLPITCEDMKIVQKYALIRPQDADVAHNEMYFPWATQRMPAPRPFMQDVRISVT